MRTELVGFAERHAGMDTIAAGLIGGSGGHSPFVGKAADNAWFAFERRIEQNLEGRKKGIDVNMDDKSSEHFLSFNLLFLANGGQRIKMAAGL